MEVVVADASVVVKWLIEGRDEEADVGPALLLLERVRSGEVRLHQPVHWLAEVASVVTRLSPSTAPRQIAVLHAMHFPVLDTEPVYQAACSLAMELNHHLFDTLYHAVALHLPGAVLVTADERYYRKAQGRGQILRLADFG